MAYHIVGPVLGVPLTTAPVHLLPKPAALWLVPNSGRSALRSSIEERIQLALRNWRERMQDTYLTWVKGHKDIKGNEEVDRLSKRASILGHESERVMTPAGLRAWSRRMRVDAGTGRQKGGGKSGIGNCLLERPDQHTPGASRTRPKRVAIENRQGGFRQVMTGAHVVEECSELKQWRLRGAEWREEWREALGGWARGEDTIETFLRARRKKEEGGEVEDVLEIFIYHV